MASVRPAATLNSATSMSSTTPRPSGRLTGSLIWTTDSPDPTDLQKVGWEVHSFRQIRDRYIGPARSAGQARLTFSNPAQPVLALLDRRQPIAVVGTPLRTAADLRDLYGFLIEPAYRRGVDLLIAGADLDLDQLDGSAFVDPIGYAWTLERVRHIAERIRLRDVDDGSVPLTPIEARLLEALRVLGLRPVAQFGIDRWRADFALTDSRVVIECDGRAWHDPARDLARDAQLRRRGWEPIHFSGSEINADAEACARRVASLHAERLTSITSEAPEIVVGRQASLWSRFLDWIRSLMHRHDPLSADSEADRLETTQPVAKSRPWSDGLDEHQRAAVEGDDGVIQGIAPRARKDHRPGCPHQGTRVARRSSQPDLVLHIQCRRCRRTAAATRPGRRHRR